MRESKYTSQSVSEPLLHSKRCVAKVLYNIGAAVGRSVPVGTEEGTRQERLNVKDLDILGALLEFARLDRHTLGRLAVVLELVVPVLLLGQLPEEEREQLFVIIRRTEVLAKCLPMYVYI
jgi:hypothetical protein